MQDLQIDDPLQIFHAPGFEHTRVLVVSHDMIERESICALLTVWRCEAEGTALVEPLPSAAPDILIVAPGEFRDVGVAVIVRLRSLYGRPIPAILISEPVHPNPHDTVENRHPYAQIKPNFTSEHLYAVLCGMVRRV